MTPSKIFDFDRLIQHISSDPETARESLERLQPYDISKILAETEPDIHGLIVELIPPGILAESLEHLDFDHQYQFVEGIQAEQARPILAAMSSDATADLALGIHPHQASRILKLLPDDHRQVIKKLMTYPEHSAGGRMNAEFIAVRKHWSASQARQHFRKIGQETESVSYIYVLDSYGTLIGVVSLRDLLLADAPTPVEEFMSTQVVAVSVDTDQEEAVSILKKYDFLAIPVIDAKRRMLGIITSDDAFDVLEVETTEDFHKVSGVTPVEIEYDRAGVSLLWRKRIGWLTILLITDFMSSSVLAHFEHAIETVVALTFFIPMLIDSGGNVGTQSATLIIRGLATGRLNTRDWWQIVRKELIVGLLLGIALGLLIYLRGFFWRGGPEVGLVVGLTMIALVFWANLMGTLAPLILTRLRVDPAVVSSPLITTAADVTGLIIYFNIARWILGL